MLLHYFADKRDLLTASLLIVTERLVALLENARSNRMPMERLLPHLAGMVKDPLIRPYTRLWLELVALAAGGDESCQGIAQRISDIFCAWIASALEVEREEERMPMASFVFATVEGFVLLDAMDCGSQITSALEAIRAHMGERWSEERPPLPGDAL